MIHMIRKNEYRRSYDAWVADRLLGIFFAVATGKLTEKSRDEVYRDAGKMRDKMYTYLDLLYRKPTVEEEQKQKVKQHSQEAYVNALDKAGGFSGIDELMGAIQGLNSAIRDIQQDGSDNADATAS